jgi:hypothetical protein
MNPPAKIDNYCIACHNRNVIAIDSISTKNNKEDMIIKLTCRKCGAKFITEYKHNGISNNTCS